MDLIADNIIACAASKLNDPSLYDEFKEITFDNPPMSEVMVTEIIADDGGDYLLAKIAIVPLMFDAIIPVPQNHSLYNDIFQINRILLGSFEKFWKEEVLDKNPKFANRLLAALNNGSETGLLYRKCSIYLIADDAFAISVISGLFNKKNEPFTIKVRK